MKKAVHVCREHCATMERCTQKQLVELGNAERMMMFIDLVTYHISISLAWRIWHQCVDNKYQCDALTYTTSIWRVYDEHVTSMWPSMPPNMRWVSNEYGSTYKQTKNTMSYNIFILIIIIIITQSTILSDIHYVICPSMCLFVFLVCVVKK